MVRNTEQETDRDDPLFPLQLEVWSGYTGEMLDLRQYQDVAGPSVHRVYPSDDEAIDPRTETRPDWT